MYGDRHIDRKKKRKSGYILLLLCFAVVAFAAGVFIKLNSTGTQNAQEHEQARNTVSNGQSNTDADVSGDLSELETLTEGDSNDTDTVKSVKTEEVPAVSGEDSGTWIKIVKKEHRLYVVEGKDKIITSYPVSVGKNVGQKQKSGDCRTPEGKFSVQAIQSAKGWSHDFRDGKGVIPNAYGPWFIRLKTGWSGIGIHGTHDPKSIGKNVTEGCIRLHNEDLQELKEKFIKREMTVIIQ
ncbi:MAG: L,D-transpeptidase [Synergistes sp.]|nr:L,D-transpeptidase [Synergistes sp.]